MKYVNVRVPDESHEWLKNAAKRENITIQKFVSRMIEREKSRGKPAIRSAVSPDAPRIGNPAWGSGGEDK